MHETSDRLHPNGGMQASYGLFKEKMQIINIRMKDTGHSRSFLLMDMNYGQRGIEV